MTQFLGSCVGIAFPRLSVDNSAVLIEVQRLPDGHESAPLHCLLCHHLCRRATMTSSKPTLSILDRVCALGATFKTSTCIYEPG
jgi:hypothetical protein